MKYQAFIFSFLLWPYLALSISSFGKTLHKWKGNSYNAVKKDETDPVVLIDENGAQSLGGIQADSLGENGQVTFSTKAEKEAVMHELDDGGSPVFNHDASVPNKAKDANDMSHYESEEINLVGNSQHKKVKPKPVRLPSLTQDGKIDTFVSKVNQTNENDALKIVKPGSTEGNSKSSESLMTNENVDSDSTEPKISSSKPKNSQHRSLKDQTTKHRSFSNEVGASNIFDMPDIDIPEDDEILPKSSKLLLGESDDSSPEKLRKSGERLTMFYDHDLQKKKQSVAHKLAGKPETMSTATVNVKGGQIAGGQISGGNIFGGDIKGGFISGGTIKGGVIKGGRMTQGIMDGGLLLDGKIAGGVLHNGTVKGGLIRGGNITGGTVSGGEILGGHVSSGFVSGGVLKKGGVEGGVLRGGTIDGGILKGGVMESGKLLGGIVWNGRVTGGTILGGEVLGGEVGEGVVIRGGRINGTVTVGHKMHLDANTPDKKLGSASPARLATHSSPQKQSGPLYKPDSQKLAFPNTRARPYSSLSTQDTLQGAIGSRVRLGPFQSQSIPGGHPNGVSSGNIANDAVVIHTKKNPNVIVLSNIANDREQIKRNQRPSDNRQQYNNYVSSSNLYSTPRYGYQATGTSATQYPDTSSYPSPPAASVQTPRQNGININQFVKQVANGANGVQRSSTEQDKGEVKPTYHWILNQIKNGEVTGTPSGKKFLAKGGIRLNRASIGFDGTATFMDGGSYAGTCISDPSLCSHGLSLEMTMKIDPTATMYRAPRYLLDSGASSFNSRGVALYTMDNKLRADVAIEDKSYCLAVPLVADKWQDVFLTYHKDGELNMYINCKLVATTQNDDQCINCHTSGCHGTDSNTKLILGRANSEPQSNFARFKAGDLSIYERYLNPQDIDKICGFSKPQKPSSRSANYMQTNPGWNSPIVASYPRTQSGFLKNAISDPQRKTEKVITFPYAQKKTETALNAPYFSPWSSWTMCSTSCGLGTKTRQRSCIYTHAQSGWQTCHGVTFQAKNCGSNCPVVHQYVKDNTETATRKDSQPVEKVNSTKQGHPKIAKPVVTITKSNSTVPQKTKQSSEKQTKSGKGRNENKSTKDVTGARRNRISKILSKLGNLLGKLD